MEHQDIVRDNNPRSATELLETLLLTLSVTGLCYNCYYLLAPWIWSKNIPFQPEDLTPWIRKVLGQDGVEIYALYIMVFVNIVSAISLSVLIKHIIGNRIRRLVVLLCAVVAIIYCATVGFTPPTNSFQDNPLSFVISESLLIMLVIIPLIALLYYLQRRFPRCGLALAALMLVPVCFIATSAISQIDYSYIFAPALRMLNGAAISDIYFQYDLLPSMLAAGWMKLGLDLNAFQILGQAAYYLAIMGVFIFSGKLFQNKELSIFLLLALVLVRIYASPIEAVACFQVTPLRLDLWIPLLLLVYRWGPYHWSAGLACGLLILFLKTFGIIYSLAYLQLLITLWIVSYAGGEREGVSLLRSMTNYGKRCFIPVMIIIGCSIASYFLFRNDVYGNYSGYYQKIGIGFMKIANDSFYWYVPAMMSTVTILLFRLRKSVPSNYLSTGFLLTYCSIGNSIYFFGRSHEHNILNISIVLLFLFFFMLDLMARFLSEFGRKEGNPTFLHRYAIVCVASAFIIIVTVSYSSNILDKAYAQVTNIAEGQLIYKHEVDKDFYRYMDMIKIITKNSTKVYFVQENDFYLYYYGGYAPVGYCNPFTSWIFTKDLNRYLQGLLDNGYYLVYSLSMKNLVSKLQYNFNTPIGDSDTDVIAKWAKQTPTP
jgi:hypothetical protein